ncbi:MAG: glycosyltransferase [Betaproteobacteria bacterium]|nr:glycosyltransferase [Betaproteobacteria bacterium]
MQHVNSFDAAASSGQLTTPPFSIVIPTFCSASAVATCLESLATQTDRTFEVVISDGGSSDQTLAVVETYRERLPSLLVSSRSDRGVYDAINRGVAMCRGTWVLILGSDDRLATHHVLSQACALLQNERAEFVYGDVLVEGHASFAKDGELYAGPFDIVKIFQKNVCQQAVFYRRSIFQHLGTFDCTYRVVADWDFALRAFAKRLDKYIPLTVAVFKGGGLSTSAVDVAFDSARPRLLLRYFGHQLIAPQFVPMRWHFLPAARVPGITPVLARSPQSGYLCRARCLGPRHANQRLSRRKRIFHKRFGHVQNQIGSAQLFASLELRRVPSQRTATYRVDSH